MILNYTHRLAFIHIPKCAGSSVKDQLRVLDETEGRYERSEAHPVYGGVHRAHLPLWLMEEMYPEDFAVLGESRCHAVLRDPQARFGSALAQRIEQFGKRDPFTLGAQELRDELETVLRFLEAHPGSPSREFCHFIPQRDFVEFKGARFVEALYRLEDVGQLMADIGRLSGHDFTTEARANQKHNFRIQALKGPMGQASALARKVLPERMHAGLKARAAALLTRRGKGDVWAGVLDAPEVQRFVADYYRGDFELLDSVPRRAAA